MIAHRAAARLAVPPSPAFETIAAGAQFRDLIAVRVQAPPEAIFRELHRVTLSDMKLARVIGEVRYLPARLAGRPQSGDAHKPFLSLLLAGDTLLLHDDAPREIITGSAAQYHHVVDQMPVHFASREAFDAFDDPAHQKLFMSIRVSPTGVPGEQWLVLEHATRALSPTAARKFGRYWVAIKPGGAFVTRQLLNAVRRRAEGRTAGVRLRPRSRPVSQPRREEGVMMTVKPLVRSVTRVAAAGAGLAALGYGAYVAVTWSRYGRPTLARADDRDDLLDRFMPTFDVVERHQTEVRAPAAVTLDAAKDMPLSSLPGVRAIFRGREMILGATPDEQDRPKGLIAEMLSLGWGVLAELPGREIVVGAVTKPWEPNVTFRAVPPDDFATFNEPGYVRIAWTLRADPIDAHRSVFRTETRAVATDADARARFRWYWSFLSPGIFLIRRLSLRPLRADAERRAAQRLPV